MVVLDRSERAAGVGSWPLSLLCPCLCVGLGLGAEEGDVSGFGIRGTAAIGEWGMTVRTLRMYGSDSRYL